MPFLGKLLVSFPVTKHEFIISIQVFDMKIISPINLKTHFLQPLTSNSKLVDSFCNWYLHLHKRERDSGAAISINFRHISLSRAVFLNRCAATSPVCPGIFLGVPPNLKISLKVSMNSTIIALLHLGVPRAQKG